MKTKSDKIIKTFHSISSTELLEFTAKLLYLGDLGVANDENL